ncbi:ATP-binding protein [Mycoplasmoides alvi]|uniref:ATP-binding protein n=1 Tax=Mycoplasmoides alvi TaxID=78580 RepID=UPI00051BAC41|nr:ATP-binding protein [Mycoplasmoides alvi]
MNNEITFDLNIKEILSDWSISDAIRELIANAIDESRLTKTEFPSINYDNNTLTIFDYGRGITSNHFIQNENEEKKQSKIVIGKFGIGLKDAVSVLFRNNKEITFYSKHGSFTPKEDFKKGINENIKTIHIKINNSIFENEGTKIVINNIDETDYKKAISNFLELSENYEKLSSSEKGEIYERNNSNKSEIFLNGMKISEDDNFLFSYNILLPNTKLKNGLNRERRNISRDVYRDNIISILKSNINDNTQKLINCLIDKREEFSDGEWSLVDVKKLIIKNTNRRILLACPDTPTYPMFKSYAMLENYEIISINKKEYNTFIKDENFKKYTLDFFGNEYISDYKGDIVNNFEPQQQNNWDWVLKKIEQLSKNIDISKQEKLRSFKFEVIEDHPNALGITIHETNTIQIVKKILSDKEKLFNTVIHEIAHAISKERDCTIEFEQALTDLFYSILLLV